VQSVVSILKNIIFVTNRTGGGWSKGQAPFFRTIANEFSFDVFERLSFGFGEAFPDEDEAGEADEAEQPEAAGVSEGGVDYGEKLGEGPAGDPEGEYGDGHGGSADAVGEKFGEENPHDRSEGDGVDGDGGQDEDEHGQAGVSEKESGAKESVEDCQGGGAEEHEGFSADAVDEENGEEGEYEYGEAGVNYVLHGGADGVAGGGEDVFGVVEDDVEAAPLLEGGEDHADEDDHEELGFEEVAEADVSDFFGGEGAANVGHFELGVFGAADA